MRFHIDKKEKLFRVFHKYSEIFYVYFRLNGLCCEIEFPSDWHEERHGWFRFGFIFFRIGLAFPWFWVVKDHHQCSGARFGFYFFEDSFNLLYGNSTGRSDDPSIYIQMPWGWRHVRHTILTEKETYDYEYTLKSGEVQERKATINAEEREWRRPWLPSKLIRKSIDIEFNDEVGEKSGSWKGGCIGCGYDMLAGETPIQCLRRMENERNL